MNLWKNSKECFITNSNDTSLAIWEIKFEFLYIYNFFLSEHLLWIIFLYNYNSI